MASLIQWGGEGQGSLACCTSRGHKELDTTWRLNYNNSNTTSGRQNSFRCLFSQDYCLNHAKSFQVTSEAFQNVASGREAKTLWLLPLVTDKNKISPNCNLKKRQTRRIHVLIAKHTYPWIHKLQRSCFDLYSSSKHKQIMLLLIWFRPFSSDQNHSKEGKWAVTTREEDARCVRNVMENGERKTMISSC